MSPWSAVAVTTLLGAAAGVCVVAGGLLVVAGLVGSTGPRSGKRLRAAWARATINRSSGSVGEGSTRLRRLARSRWFLAPVVGLLAWLVSGWPVVGLIIAVVVVAAPALFGGGLQTRRELARLEALQSWTRRLADLRTAGGGLEQTLSASLKTCPEPIRSDVGTLIARLRAGWRIDAALRAFANDLDEPAGDLVVAVLLLDAERRGGGVANVLDDLADTVAEEVTMRRKVEADRAKPRTSARIVTAITFGAAGIGAFNTVYIQPYGTPVGQLILAVIAAGIALCLWWMRRVAAGTRAPRLLEGAGQQPGTPEEVPTS